MKMKSMTRNLSVSILLLAALFAVGRFSHGIESEKGRALHEEKCLACHDFTTYTRQNRRVDSLDALKNQVSFCEANLRLSWFEEEIDNVTAFLNGNFYHFKPE